MARRFTTALADVPELLALWDPEANGDADPGQIGSRSSDSRMWSCPVADDHRWPASPAAISNSLAKGYTGCPSCAGRQLSVINSFAARYPQGVDLWHPTANGDLTPDMVLGGSPDAVWWKCPAGPDHEWDVSPLVLGASLAHGRRGCPFCAGKRASVTNSVASHAQLSAEWHPTKNDGLKPDQIVAGTGSKLWWRCLENPEHEWPASGANRTRGRGCPRCKKSLKSVLEVCLRFELAECIDGLEPAGDGADDTVVVDGVVRYVDMLIRTGDGPDVVVEVDGRYRHAGAVELDRDTRKTQGLTAAGYRALRVREHPLGPITECDVVVPTDATVKQAADAVLTRLRDLRWLPLRGVDAYLGEREPRRVEEALELLRAQRSGKKVKLPGPKTFTRPGRWEEGFAVLTAFVAREGHANVPWEHVEDGVLLGKWVGAKRAQHRRGRMLTDRVAALEALPGWTWDAVASEWETGYQRLLAFHASEGHIDVPAHFVDATGLALGSWVRSHRRRGGRRTMTPEQATRLETVPGWTYTPPTQAAWEASFAALEAFMERQGHGRLPTGHREAGINIDAWAAAQRSRYHRGKLAADRVERLEAIPGWSWAPMEAAWEAHFAALTAHAGATGSAAVRGDLVVDGHPVGAWVGEQRMRHRRGTLPDERRVRLEALPGWVWDRHAHSWEQHFAALLAFVAREGHAEVPTGHDEDGLSLSAWVIRHRQDYKAGKVPVDRVMRLEVLPGWTWDVLAKRWERHFAALNAFVAREGHAHVPSGHLEDAVKLGSWVISQRQQYRLGELPAERVARLEALPGWVWAARRGAVASELEQMLW